MSLEKTAGDAKLRSYRRPVAFSHFLNSVTSAALAPRVAASQMASLAARSSFSDRFWWRAARMMRMEAAFST